ncbi:hypothetical protein N8654_00320 [Synechococcus sp. AH-601-B19]|nr:hypothetical protein [Synechococcus sp. AH-601-B19]
MQIDMEIFPPKNHQCITKIINLKQQKSAQHEIKKQIIEMLKKHQKSA